MSEPILTIKSAQDAVELALTDASVTMKLSESVLNEAQSEMQRDLQRDSDVQKGGLAGRFSQFVAHAVDSLLHQTIEYDIADIKSVEYQDGGLVFSYNKKHAFSFETVSVENKPALKSFAEADARAFVQQFAQVKQSHR
ncbi:MAG: hypothetical protein ACLQUY_02690 [Ktedonobacterales bacterium]